MHSMLVNTEISFKSTALALLWCIEQPLIKSLYSIFLFDADDLWAFIYLSFVAGPSISSVYMELKDESLRLVKGILMHWR